MIAGGAGKSVLTKYQVGLDQSLPISVNYSGNIKGALDLIATKTGYVYNLRGGKSIGKHLSPKHLTLHLCQVEQII